MGISLPGFDLDPILGLAAGLAFLGLTASLLLAFVRLVRGPTLPDRVVALDIIAYQVIAFIGLYTAVTREAAFLDAAIILALIAFLATVAFARFVERSGRQGDRT